VPRAFLFGVGQSDRTVWIEMRLQELAKTFAISVRGFSILEKHLHVLVRIDPEVAQGTARRRRAGSARGLSLEQRFDHPRRLVPVPEAPTDFSPDAGTLIVLKRLTP
jgi:hypothetical protein